MDSWEERSFIKRERKVWHDHLAHEYFDASCVYDYTKFHHQFWNANTLFLKIVDYVYSSDTYFV